MQEVMKYFIKLNNDTEMLNGKLNFKAETVPLPLTDIW